MHKAAPAVSRGAAPLRVVRAGAAEKLFAFAKTR